MDGPEALRLGLALVMLLVASVSDLRTRRVANHYWLPFVAFAAILWLGDLGAGVDRALLLRALWALGTCAVLYAMWWLGTFGGADAKGLMVLAWLWPGLPDLLGRTLTPTIDTLVNGSFLAVVLPFLFLAWNLAHGRFAGLATFLGVEMDVARAQARHVWPMRRIDHQGRLAWRFWGRPGEDLEQVYEDLRRHGVDRVWVTPKLPFMLNLAAGAVLAASMGNVALRLAQQILL